MSRSRMLLGTATVLMCCAMAGWSQETTKPTTKSTAVEKKQTNRLPANYGKLGLTDAQRDKIYAVQEKYDSQLDALEEQIKALRAKRSAESEAVLSPEQKKILKDLNEEAKETKSKPKKADEKTKE